MENNSLIRKILYSSLASIVIFSGLLLLGLTSDVEGLIILPVVLLSFSLIAIITIYAIKFQNILWFKRITKNSTFILPLLIVSAVLIGNYNEGIPALLWALVILSIFVTFLTLIYLFVYSDATSLTGVILLILLILTGMLMKRQHWPLAGMTMTIFTLLLCTGCFMFGLRCLFLSGKITYFRNITFAGSILMAIAYLGQMFKLQHWPGAGPMVITGFAGLILGTMYVLITLHSSGYIEWQPLHKKILRKILIPWTFIFLMYISRYMIPELNTLMWTSPDRNKKIQLYGFSMKDYSIEEKNGIKN